MSFFDIHFLVFKLTTIWQPEFNSIWKSVLYNIYSITFAISFGLSGVSIILFLFINDWDIFILSTNLFATVTYLIVTLEIINLKRHKKKIFELTEVLKKPPFSPENIDEQFIISKYEKMNRKQITVYGIFLMSGATCFFIGKIIKAHVPVFPYYIWVPYDLSNPYYYWITLLFRTSSLFIGVSITVQFVLFFSSASLIIQSQVALLKYRYKKSMEMIEKKYNNCDKINRDKMNELKVLEKKLIVDFVNNHLEVLKLASLINDIFSIDIFVYYSTSTVLICTTAYVASTVPLFSHDFFSTVFLCVAAICGTVRICYSSNGILIVFEELHRDITSANWTILNEKTKKSLMIVLMQTRKPFAFTTGVIIKPSHESLKDIAQVAYSLYNLMRKTS